MRSCESKRYIKLICLLKILCSDSFIHLVCLLWSVLHQNYLAEGLIVYIRLTLAFSLWVVIVHCMCVLSHNSTDTFRRWLQRKWTSWLNKPNCSKCTRGKYLTLCMSIYHVLAVILLHNNTTVQYLTAVLDCVVCK